MTQEDSDRRSFLRTATVAGAAIAATGGAAGPDGDDAMKVAASSDSEAISEPHIARSVIFQVIWSLGPNKPHPF